MQPGRITAIDLPTTGISRLRGKSFAFTLGEMLGRYWDTIGTQVLTAVLGVISGALALRLLGPKGRGELAAVTLWPIALTFLGGLGIDRASVYFAAKKRPEFSSVATSCAALGATQTFAVFVAGLVVIPLVLRGYSSKDILLALMFLASAPFILAGNFQAGLLLGNQDTHGYNLFRLVAPVTYSGAVVVSFVLHIPSISGIVLLELVGFVLAAATVTWLVRSHMRPTWNWDARLAKDMVKYGAKTHAGDVSNFLNQRLDQLLMSMLLPSAALGYYVAAVAFADGVLIVPRGIGSITLVDSSNVDRRRAWQVARRSLLHAAVWLVSSCVCLWLLCPVVIPALLGAKFAPSVLPCRILIPGSCAMGLTTVLFEAARGMNHPEITAYAEAAGLGVTAILLAFLLKPYGPVGAALASTIAYVLTFALTLLLLSMSVRASNP
jgi:O-antigen/teichoic acid export membrane protein